MLDSDSTFHKLQLHGPASPELGERGTGKHGEILQVCLNNKFSLCLDVPQHLGYVLEQSSSPRVFTPECLKTKYI